MNASNAKEYDAFVLHFVISYSTFSKKYSFKAQPLFKDVFYGKQMYLLINFSLKDNFNLIVL